ncbi:hypothetical protein [Parvularcula marina]|uniref:hypothetical protein n=1 Tax=Parvularcula marina TaxID=2292771 RepID=UPI003512A717
MLRLSLFLSASALFAVSCAYSGSSEPEDPQVGWVSFETRPGPFCGRCDSLKLTVFYDQHVLVEQGYWRGDYEDWQVSNRLVKVSPTALSNFLDRLAPHRPKDILVLREESQCESFWTDHPEVFVLWRDAKGYSQLHYNYGCDRELRQQLAEALSSAPRLLEITGLENPAD